MGVFDMVVKFVWAKGYRKVEIESDNSLLITVIQNGLVANNNYSEQILRENNGVANRITKEARGEMDHLIIHEEP
ncbi:hypothetical protein Goklo_029372 [Gossypium klotzschianum]|uniref:RNase H type-1 domain-containing protein n=1 Tax=Gossypium klotzschianum TaxID=34286 RepID=A0A7J8W3Q5_9ROSI|nr:hypothetical protein [Gossypium klotzschianum]